MSVVQSIQWHTERAACEGIKPTTFFLSDDSVHQGMNVFVILGWLLFVCFCISIDKSTVNSHSVSNTFYI